VLKKREFEDILSKSEKEMADIISKKQITINRIISQKKLELGEEDKKRRENTPLKLTKDQMNKLMTFDSEINDLILRVYKIFTI